MILHIALPEDWAAARAAGHYTVSTRGATVDRVGFLHASEDAAQVGIVGPAVYADRPDAVVLAMDEAALEAAGLTVRREPGVPGDPHSPLFPHVYGGPVPVGLMTPLPRADVDPRVVREDDAEALRLQDAGWTPASTSPGQPGCAWPTMPTSPRTSGALRPCGRPDSRSAASRPTTWDRCVAWMVRRLRTIRPRPPHPIPRCPRTWPSA